MKALIVIFIVLICACTKPSKKDQFITLSKIAVISGGDTLQSDKYNIVLINAADTLPINQSIKKIYYTQQSKFGIILQKKYYEVTDVSDYVIKGKEYSISFNIKQPDYSCFNVLYGYPDSILSTAMSPHAESISDCNLASFKVTDNP